MEHMDITYSNHKNSLTFVMNPSSIMKQIKPTSFLLFDLQVAAYTCPLMQTSPIQIYKLTLFTLHRQTYQLPIYHVVLRTNKFHPSCEYLFADAILFVKTEIPLVPALQWLNQ